MNKSILANTEEIQQYIKDIRKNPVISHERQEQIFERLNDKNITKHEKKFLYDELVVGNLRFVISVAKMYQNQGMDIMDFFIKNMEFSFVYKIKITKKNQLSKLSKNFFSSSVRLPKPVFSIFSKTSSKSKSLLLGLIYSTLIFI